MPAAFPLRTPTAAAGLALALLAATPAAAQWPADPSVNLAVCIAANGQFYPVLVSGADGGSIALWNDARNGYQAIYGQRFDAAGVAQWTANGLALATASGGTGEMSAVSDGSGGVIMAWFDLTGPITLYAQRFAADGSAQWTSGGVVVTASGLAYTPMVLVAPDGAGGADIVWSSGPAYSISRLHAQRIDATGQLQWSGPVFVSTDTTLGSRPQVDSDGAGGVVVAWSSLHASVWDVIAQRIDAKGARLWGDAGITAAPPGTFNRFRPGVARDAAGGAVVVWSQTHSVADASSGARPTGLRMDLLAQRIDAVGTRLWVASGVALSLGAPYGAEDTVCTDGAGGAYVSYFSDSVRVQHVTGGGALPWGTGGIAMKLLGGSAFVEHPIVPAPDGGVILCWQPNSTYPRIAGQSISAAGQLHWGAQGVMVSTTDSWHIYPALVADGYGGATFAWSDSRNTGNLATSDIYAQHVGAAGTLDIPVYPDPPHAIRLTLASVPCPARVAGSVQLRFALPADGRVRLGLYDVSGRLVRVLVDERAAMGWRTADWDGRDGNGRTAPAGVYLARLASAAGVVDARIVRLP